MDIKKNKAPLMAMTIKIARLYIRSTYAESLIFLHIFFVQRVEHFKDNIYTYIHIKRYKNPV